MKRHAGFSVIELMIAIVLMGILLTMGLPAFNTYLNNIKLRTAAQSFLAGIQTARGEAIRRNANVDFVLTNDNASGPNFDTVTPLATGQNWLIRTSDLTTYVEGKSGAEGGGRSTGESSPVLINGSASTITFNGLGATTLGASATFQFTNPSGGLCASAGGAMRCLNVVISPGGQSRICDPAVTPAQTAAGDTRGC
jgi:type IV fimbrial biogenesis protein FimT